MTALGKTDDSLQFSNLDEDTPMTLGKAFRAGNGRDFLASRHRKVSDNRTGAGRPFGLTLDLPYVSSIGIHLYEQGVAATNLTWYPKNKKQRQETKTWKSQIPLRIQSGNESMMIGTLPWVTIGKIGVLLRSILIQIMLLTARLTTPKMLRGKLKRHSALSGLVLGAGVQFADSVEGLSLLSL